MALIPELLSNIILLVTGPFALIKLSCVFIIRTAFLFIYTWTELVKTAVRFHLNLIWRIISWTVGIISIPARVLNALQRERQLEQQLLELQNELENLVGDQKVLQDHLKIAIRERKERKMIEALLSDLEEEHNMATVKIEQLEDKLQDLKDENCRLKEIQGKAYWSTDNGQNIGGSSHSILSGNSNYNGSGIALQSLLIQKDIWEDESKNGTELLKVSKTGSKSGTALLVRPEAIAKEVERRKVLSHRRDAALCRSLFSAFLSLVVGVIVWEAEDPCMPLVVALFTVVGMSLRSVVQFFSTIKNKPASYAVALLSIALLSINWFILGTLTYPTLPKVARMLSPTLFSLLEQTMTKTGILYS